MTTLKNIQQQMRQHIVSGIHDPDPALIAQVRKDSLDPRQRLQIYQNNFRETLFSSLEAYFPAVKTFVGHGFFRTACRFFIRKYPPQEARLAYYGKKFGNFLKEFEHASSIPYIGDLADLEWAVNECQNAATLPLPSAQDVLKALKDNRLRLQPYVRLVESNYPVGSLWMAAKGMIPAQSVHVNQGGQNCLTIRQNRSVHLIMIDNQEAAVLKIFTEPKNVKISLPENTQKIVTSLCDRNIFLTSQS